MPPLPMPGGPMGPPPGMPPGPMGASPGPLPGGPMPPPMAPPGGDTSTLMSMLAMNFQRKTSQDLVRDMVKLGRQIRDRDEKLAPRMTEVLNLLQGGPELDAVGDNRVADPNAAGRD